jgi:CRP-like cAMP-binding protein
VQPSQNSLIAQLTHADQAMLLRNAQEIKLQPGDVLACSSAKTSSIYFPVGGSIALYVAGLSQPSSAGLAVGLIGSEGAVGLQAALGLGAGHFQLLVQSAGEAYAVKALTAQRLIHNRQRVLLMFSRYLWSMYESVVDLALRAHTQDTYARLAHWLLISKKCCGHAPLRLTHEHIAKMLGVRRSSISLVAHDMKLKRYINYSRGTVVLLNISALEALANR